jgi:hypothetical protein
MSNSNKIIIRLPEPHSGGQEIFLNWNQKNPKAQCLVAPSGTKIGKCLNSLEKIPTPQGFKLLKDIEVGDYVFSEHGKPIKVIWISELMYGHDCFEITFIDGTKIIADAEHLWLTETDVDRKNQARVISSKDICKSTASKPSLRTTIEIKNTLTIEIGNLTRANHSIKLISAPLEYPEKEYLIEPYVLGVWLGDGCRWNGTYTKPDSQVISEIKSYGYSVSDYADGKTHNIFGLKAKLNQLGLLKNKHVPNEYLYGSPKQRLDLLQGLMDTDGTINVKGRCCFDNTNKSIADAFAEIAVSLGIKIFRNERIGKLYGVEKKNCYRINFTTDIPIFRLKRKLDRLKKVSIKNKHRTIIDIKPIKSVPVKCIKVDNPTSLFLVSDACIPTHNTFGSSIWMLTEALSNQSFYCAWIAPTYLKCKIAFRYMINMLPKHPWIKPVQSKLEITFANGTLIKFLHGKDAETVIEGENIDRFVIDETAKIDRQVWLSLLTTITQTRGIGIVTGTPRGFNWYYEIFKKATEGDPFFVWSRLKTEDSPYVSKHAIDVARRLLPANLFAQYYLAEFTSAASLFGDLSNLWDNTLPSVYNQNYWIHPKAEMFEGEITHGIDLAKKRDYTVIYSVNTKGNLVGFVRLRFMDYPMQVRLIKKYIMKFFTKSENAIRYDATGIGDAVGDILIESDIPADITPVVFTNQSKSEMLTKMILSIQSGWHKIPYIEAINHEFSVYEITISRFGSHKYSAPEGEHDDIVSAAMLAISRAYDTDKSDEAFKLLSEHFKDGPNPEEIIKAYDNESEFDEFFETENSPYDFEFEEDKMDI